LHYNLRFFVREIILLSASTKQFVDFRPLSAVIDGQPAFCPAQADKPEQHGPLLAALLK
jgi:hypothetical protein